MAQRAWLGLAAVLGGTAVVYLLSYLRTMRKIVEQPEIAPGSRSTWLPRFGGPLETAIVRFSIRTLLRSRQHRVILAFFLGLGFACTVLLIKTPMAQDIAAASPDDPWTRAGVPLLASTFAMMAFAVVGMRIVFAMPLEPRSNWIFRAMALQGGPALVRARRRALLVLGMWPMLLLWAIVLFSLWPWREAALHLAVLGLSGSILAELCLRGTQKIPFTCAYLPGKANVHVTFWMCITLFYALVVEFAEMERRALHHPAFSALMIGTLALIWLALRWWSSTQSEGGPEFEEIPADAIQQLGL
jgi:hypothetical protein